ncbi:hypothetical protein MRX96_029533 [Rhipicephalus microplus]
MISGGGFGVPMPGGYGGPMMPPYGTPPMMMGSGFGLPMPGGYGGPMMRPYGAPMPDMTSAYSTERFLGGYERPAMNPRHVWFHRLAKRRSEGTRKANNVEGEHQASEGRIHRGQQAASQAVYEQGFRLATEN